MPQALTDDSRKQERMKFHPNSSAIGYNQLLTADTVEDFKVHGGEIAGRLKEIAASERDPVRANELLDKAQLTLGVQEAINHGYDTVTHGRKGRNRTSSRRWSV